MPFRDRLRRARHKVKNILGVSSDNSSSTSLPVSISSGPGPDSRTSRRVETPLLQAPDAPETARSSFTAGGLAPNIAGSIPSPTPVGVTPALVIVAGSQRAVFAPSSSVPDDTDAIAGTNERRHAGAFAWSGLKTLLKVVESSSDVFPPLKSAVSGLNKCIEISENASKGRKEYQELQKKLDSLLEDLSEHIGGATSAKMTMGMQNLCMGLNTELALVQDKSARGLLRAHAEALEESNEIMECYRRIQEHLERLALNANLSTWEIVDRLEAEARLQKLSSAVLAVYNSAKSVDVQRRACTTGTREEELAKLLTWARDKASEKHRDIFWMNGMAGTGKTTITYSLCAELERSGALGASFFCSRLIPECRDVKLIIPAIAYQLARYSRPFRCALSQVLEADPDVHIRVLTTQFDRLIVEPLTRVKHTLPTDFVVVVDALDECDNPNAVGEILDVLLSGIFTSELPIRFLLSSRPEPEIYTRMVEQLGVSQNVRLVLHDLDQKKVKHDIETFLRAELQSISLSPSQLTDLVDRCGVLFIFASTAARYIKDGLRVRQHEKRLKTVLNLESASTRGNHQDIDQLYTSILATAFDSRYLDEDDRTLMKMILDTAICAQEPMTVDALAGLLRVTESQQIDALLRPLYSVVNIAETSGLITTLHASFSDFMFDSQRSSSFHCDATATHARVSRTCFQVIRSNKLQFNIAALESSYLRDADVLGLHERVDNVIYQHLYYSCRYWMAHLTAGGAQDKSEELLDGLLSESLLLWMEVLNLKRNMHIGTGIMHQAEEWARRNNYRTETVELAHDAWRFVTMFTSHVISQSTPHIYISILAFWPASAPITQKYKARYVQTVHPHGTAMTRRQLALLATWSFKTEIRSISLSPDDSLIACSLSESVHIIDGTTGQAIVGPLEHNDEVRGTAFSPDGTLLASCSKDKTVKVWDSSNGQLVSGPLMGHEDWVISVCFTPDSKRVVSGSRDGTIRIWNIESRNETIGPLQGHDGGVWSVCVSFDGTRVASCSDDKTVRVWNAESGELLLGPLEGHTGYIWSISFSPDNTRIASSSDDGTIRIWSSLAGHTHVDILEGHNDWVESVDFSPNGNQIASGSGDNTVRLWDVQSAPQLARVFTGHANVIWCVRFSSDGARIVSSSGDSTIRVWDARSQGPADSPLEGHTQAVTSVAFSHVGRRIVSGSNDGTIYVWDGQSGEVAVGPMKGHSDWVNSVCVSPDGSRIASGSQDKTIQLWDAYTGQATGKPLTGHSENVRSVCFSPDGVLLASGSDDMTIRLWNAESGEPIGSPFEAHTSAVTSGFFSPDNLRLVSGSGDKTILIWDVNTGKPVLPPLRGHTDHVWAVFVSPDRTRIASGSGDTTVRLWDANDGQSVIGPLLGHTAIVRSVCFSPNSAYVISGSDDKTIRLWDARSGQAIGSPLVGHTEPVRSVAFSPDGGQIVSGGCIGDHSIRVWDVADLVQPQEPKDDINKGTESPHAHQSWVLQDDGWVVDPESRLLAWVPPDLHTSLMGPRNPLLISTKGSVQLEFESAKLGESWAECYEPAS